MGFIDKKKFCKVIRKEIRKEIFTFSVRAVVK